MNQIDLSNISLPEGLSLIYDEDNRLCLTNGEISMCGDFGKLKKRLKPNNLNGEMLVKATKFKNAKSSTSDKTLTLIDATAGMGEDSLLLAAAGFHVKLFEYNPVIAVLLQDALRRGLEDEELAPIVSRMEFVPGDSLEYLKNTAKMPDVVYLDPMFPARQKSGLIKKKFQLLQKLESPCSEENDMLEAAIKANPKRIVIKRPQKGPYLAGKKPSYSIGGKAIRYDCIVVRT